LVRLKVDVIVVGGTLAATKRATSTIPIVVGSAGDLVGGGYVASLARPGGNIKRKKEKPEDKTEISEIDAPPLSKELKKRWAYFIRKVYETDPLICFYN
jgi:hypothetical protein